MQSTTASWMTIILRKSSTLFKTTMLINISYLQMITLFWKSLKMLSSRNWIKEVKTWTIFHKFVKIIRNKATLKRSAPHYKNKRIMKSLALRDRLIHNRRTLKSWPNLQPMMIMRLKTDWEAKILKELPTINQMLRDLLTACSIVSTQITHKLWIRLWIVLTSPHKAVMDFREVKHSNLEMIKINQRTFQSKILNTLDQLQFLRHNKPNLHNTP